ncbi:MAG: ATP-binding cassette domain-containing protein [Mucinivorans sp.]
MLGKLFSIIPPSMRARTISTLAVAVVGVMLDLVAVVGFVPLLAIIANPQQVTANEYLNTIYQWSGARNELVFTLVLAAILLVVLVIKNAIVLRISYCQKRFTSRLFDQLSVAAFKYTYAKGLLYIRTNNSNKLINDIGHSTLVFATLVVGGWITILSESFLLVVICVLVSVYNPILFVALLLIFVPFAMIYTKILRKKMQQMGKQENEMRILQYRTLNESLRGYTDVQLSRSFERVIAQYRTLLQGMAKPRVGAEIFREMPSRLIELVVLMGIIVLISVNLIWQNNVGSQLMLTMGVFVIVAYKVMPAINRMLAAWSTLHKCDFATDFCGSITNDEQQTEPDENEEFDSLALDHITFAYPGHEPIFNDFSLRIARGERVLVSGASGCGKSTLLHIMMGFYEPQKGRVLVNEIEKRYGKIGYVSQEIFIMDDTLMANITMQAEVDWAQFEKVWKWVGLENMGVGRDERLREWGNRLSGGQRQRIAIARALYRNAELLILDEATAALDQKAEKQIIDCVDALPRSVTIICVAHRPVNDAWRVVKL